MRTLALTAGIGIGCALVVAAVAANHALPVQVLAAGTGAVLTTGGVGLAATSWPRRRSSEVRNLLAAVGVLAFCVGVVAMLAGVGLYH